LANLHNKKPGKKRSQNTQKNTKDVVSTISNAPQLGENAAKAWLINLPTCPSLYPIPVELLDLLKLLGIVSAERGKDGYQLANKPQRLSRYATS
jgi:hypothetical protein